jgi:penicillin-binding protein 2
MGGDTVSVAIGQGYVTVTPIQLATAIGGMAIGGEWHRPHLLIADTKTEKPRTLKLDPDNVKKVVDGMYGVVNEGGTGGRAIIPGIRVCGKTGSAQTASLDYAKSHGGTKDNSWFVGFAPCEAPEVVIAALWEGGVQGAYSAAIVRDVMKAYFDKKARLHMTKSQVGQTMIGASK